MKASKHRLRALLGALLLVVSHAIAHQPETSYARVRVVPERLEVRFTFDAFALARIVPALDADGDHALSTVELQAASPAVERFLRTHVRLEIDEKPASLGPLMVATFPSDTPDPIPAPLWHTNEALISFRFEQATARSPDVIALFFDLFGILGERHSILGVFEHAGQSHEVVFTSSEPDYLYDLAYAEGREVIPVPGASGPPPPPRGHPLLRFLWLGVEHILLGFDHLCFLLALLVVARLRPLIAIVTSFTVAHSITLILAAQQIVTLPSRLVECAIALTIVYVAVENLVRREPAHRWRLTFAFGLIHGFGFANVLGAQELPRESFIRCLLSFNVGVELGQLAFVAAVFPLTLLAARLLGAARVRITVSTLVAALGFAWFLDRALVLGWMPF